MRSARCPNHRGTNEVVVAAWLPEAENGLQLSSPGSCLAQLHMIASLTLSNNYPNFCNCYPPSCDTRIHNTYAPEFFTLCSH